MKHTKNIPRKPLTPPPPSLKEKVFTKQMGIIAAVALVVLIAIGIGLVFLLRIGPLPGQIETFGQYHAMMHAGTSGNFLVLRNEEWAVRTADGEFIVPFGQYHALALDSWQNPLFLDNYFAAISNDIIYIIDAKTGDVVAQFSEYDEIFFLTSEMFIAVSGSQIGVVNRDGESIISAGDFSDFAFFDHDNGWIVASRTRNDAVQIALFDLNGETIIPFGRYSWIRPFGNELFVVSARNRTDSVNSMGIEVSNHLSAVVDLDGNYIIEFSDYFTIWNTDADIYIVQTVYELWGVHGIIEPVYEEIRWTGNETNMLAALHRTQGWVLYNSLGNILLPHGQYEDIQYLNNGHFALRSEGLWGVVTAQFEEVLPAQFDLIGVHYVGGGFINISAGEHAGIIVSRGRLYGVMGFDGNEIIPIRYEFIEVDGGYFVAHLDGYFAIYDQSGTQIISTSHRVQVNHGIMHGVGIFFRNGEYVVVDLSSE
ncbi:MAG: WG repeat-containing protein [Oscillospiraceae bacterium]|nr:WG repeat-containing protein [Oscillospiraceae bacterium]